MKKLLYIILILSIFSCKEKEIEFDGVAAEPVIALSAFFTPTEPFVVELTSTQSIIGDQSEKTVLTNGSVTIYDGDKIVEKILYNPNKRKYIGYLKPSVKKTYTVKASAKNFKSVSAKVYIPEQVEITNVKLADVTPNKSDFESGNFGDTKATVTFKIPKEKELNYYMIVLKGDGVDIDGYKYERKIPISITSKDAALAGNKNGEMTFGDSEYKNRFNIFTDELFEEKTYSLSVLFSKYEAQQSGDDSSGYHILVDANLKVNIQSISEDYFKFLKSYENQLDSGDSPFTEPFQLWTNVTNGTGIVAGYSNSEASAHIGDASLLSEMTINGEQINNRNFPLNHSVKTSSAEIYISTYENFKVSVYSNGVYVENSNDHFDGVIKNLKIGENKLMILLKSKNGASIVYDFVINRTE